MLWMAGMGQRSCNHGQDPASSTYGTRCARLYTETRTGVQKLTKRMVLVHMNCRRFAPSGVGLIRSEETSCRRPVSTCPFRWQSFAGWNFPGRQITHIQAQTHTPHRATESKQASWKSFRDGTDKSVFWESLSFFPVAPIASRQGLSLLVHRVTMPTKSVTRSGAAPAHRLHPLP